MMEPENVMAPMINPRLISMRLARSIEPTSPMLNALGDRKAQKATSTAAKPTNE